MAGRGVPGVAPDVEKRQKFARLIAQGVSNQRACKIVGINRKTGTRWRLGRVVTSRDGRRRHYLAVIDAPRAREISPRYLSEDERIRIADRQRHGGSVRAIAREIGRSPSTVSRELRRNATPEGGGYRPFAAQRMAARRRARPGRGKLIGDEVLRSFVTGRLSKKWSPEQVSHALPVEFPDEPARHLSPETIYQAIYRPELGGLIREFPKGLRTGRRRRKPHRHPDARRPTKLVDMTMIDQRPADAADREVAGHWEGDLITGKQNRSAIGTLVERRSRFTILLHLPGQHTADAVRDAIIAALGPLPPQLRRSLTWDQGSELAQHADIAAALGMPVYFCDAHSPWQRPSNENTNGLLRQYFPKGSNLHVHDAPELAIVAAELNDRPRKTLAWATPGRPVHQIAAGRAHRRAGGTPRPGTRQDGAMPDMRREHPEPQPGMPPVVHRPGLAADMLRDLAPLLAEEGIDVDDIDVPDIATLQTAMNRAVERANMARFTPVGKDREYAVVTLRLVVEALAESDTHSATAILDSVRPESPNSDSATVSGCIGVALGLLDNWLSGHDPQAPPGLAQYAQLPVGHWDGGRAATDILTLAANGRAFASLDKLIIRHGGQRVLYGAALAVAAAAQAWAGRTDNTMPRLIRDVIR